MLVKRKWRLERGDIKRFIGGFTVGLMIFVFACFNIVLVWVATGPRSLDVLTPYIEDAFKGDDDNYTIKIEQTWLVWDGWRHPLDIRLRNVRVLTQQGQVFSSFPEISLGLDLIALPFGEVLPTSLEVSHPIVTLLQNEDRSISFGPGGGVEAGVESPAVPFAAVIAPVIDPGRKNSLRKLHYVAIRDADVSVGSYSKGVFFQASNVSLEIGRDRKNTVNVFAKAHISYAQHQSDVDARLTLGKELPTIDGQLTFEQLMPGALAGLFADNKLLHTLDLPLSGKASFSMDKNASLQQLAFQVEGGAGRASLESLELGLPIDALFADGQIGNDFNDIQINKLTAIIDGMPLTADGTISISGSDAAVRVNASLKNISGGKLAMLWPKKLAPMSREWVTANITDGRVPLAEIHTNIQFGDLAKPALPAQAIDASVHLEGAKIRYLPEHPQAHNVKAVVKVNGVGLHADILGAEFLKSTKVSSGAVDIADLNAANPHIIVSLAAETSAKDAVTFLGLPRLGHAANLNLKEDAVSGSASVTAKVGFDFFAPHDAKGRPLEPKIDYEVAAQVKDVSQPGFMKKFDIVNGDGAMTVNNKELTFKGTGEINGARVSQASVRYLFAPENGFDTFIDAKAAVPAESLPRFGYKLPFLKGTIGVNGSAKQGENAEINTAAIDLTGASIFVKDIGLSKPAGEPATLDIASEKKGGEVSITSFHLKGKDLNAKGSAALDDALTGFKRITLQKSTLGNTDIERLSYEYDGGYRIDVEAKSIDLTSYLAHDEKETGNFSFQHFPAVEFKGALGRVIFGKGRELTGVKGDLRCDAKICNSANFNAAAGGKPVTFRILRNPKGKRQVSLHAENAAAFLRAVDVFDGMDGGDFSITGNYDEAEGLSRLKGNASITEYTIKRAPVLAKILSLASLTGFFDTLQGNGIRFDRFKAPFTLQRDVITVKSAKTHGSAFGMTMEGTVTMPKMLLDMHGTLVPAYALNSVLGKVPLVGQLLTGGEGKGLFAFSYTIKGTEQTPDVSVNPLSILTPGFLRGIFEGGDEEDSGE